MPTNRFFPVGRVHLLPWLATLAVAVTLAGWMLTASQPVRAAGDCTISSSEAAIDSEEQRLLELINQYRAQNGRATWKFSPTLNRAAAWKSRDMATNNYFSHNDRDGRDMRTRMADCGYNVSVSWGENITAGTYRNTAESALDSWKASPTHNALLLDTQYTYKVAGVGRAYQASSSYSWYWTLDVGGYDDSGTTATPTPTPTLTPTPTSTTTPTPTPTPTSTTTRGQMPSASVQEPVCERFQDIRPEWLRDQLLAQAGCSTATPGVSGASAASDMGTSGTSSNGAVRAWADPFPIAP